MHAVKIGSKQGIKKSRQMILTHLKRVALKRIAKLNKSTLKKNKKEYYWKGKRQ